MKIANIKGHDYTTKIVYQIILFSQNYSIIVGDLGKLQALDTDQKATQ